MTQENGNEIALVEEPGSLIRYRQTATIGALVGALAKATQEFTPALKDARNPAYGQSRYAPLENLIEATRPALCANGLVVLQLPKLKGQNVEVSTLLAHSSGEWIVGSLELPATMRDRFDAQSVGSGITYCRRYAYQSILNIAGEVDDDGNAAAGVGSKEAAQAVANGKLADNPFIEFQSTGDGLLKLIGPTGIPLLRANMTDAERELMVWLPNARAFVVADENMPKIIPLCERLHIKVMGGKAPTAPLPAKPITSAKEPTIVSAETKVKGQKTWLEVMYGNDAWSKKFYCFDKDLHPYIKEGIGKTAELVTEPGQDKKYTHIIGINRIGEQTFSEIDGKYRPDIQRLPYQATDEDVSVLR